jgi:DNA-binding MarR family transcriptional regulator
MRVYLTTKGRRLQPQLEAAAKHCIDNMTSELDANERVELRRLLEKMASPLVRENQPE